MREEVSIKIPHFIANSKSWLKKYNAKKHIVALYVGDASLIVSNVDKISSDT